MKRPTFKEQSKLCSHKTLERVFTADPNEVIFRCTGCGGYSK